MLFTISYHSISFSVTKSGFSANISSDLIISAIKLFIEIENMINHVAGLTFFVCNFYSGTGGDICKKFFARPTFEGFM